MNIETTHFEWDVDTLAAGLKLRPERVVAMYRDGRAASPLCREALMDRYDLAIGGRESLVTKEGKRIRLRTLTDRLNLKASNGHGGSRDCTVPSTMMFLDGHDGIFIADAENFPMVRCWLIPTQDVLTALAEGKLADGDIRRERALEVLENRLLL